MGAFFFIELCQRAEVYGLVQRSIQVGVTTGNIIQDVLRYVEPDNTRRRYAGGMDGYVAATRKRAMTLPYVRRWLCPPSMGQKVQLSYKLEYIASSGYARWVDLDIP